MKHSKNHADVLLLPPGEGRVYNCGPMTAIFKADENETAEKYSISEWWIAPNSAGPGPHQDDEDDEIFYVLEGIIAFLIGDKWNDAEKGTFIRLPPNTIHSFANRTNENAGMLSFKVPGGFEKEMPAIAAWFDEPK